MPGASWSLLRADRDAAEHDRCGEPHPVPVGAEAVGDLARQLPSRGEHQRPAAAARRRQRPVGEPL